MIWEENSLRKVCEKSETIAEVLRQLGLAPRGSNYKTFQRYVKLFNIDTSHFVGFAHSNRKNLLLAHAKKQKTLSEILVSNSCFSTGCLKKRLIKERIIPYKCSICGIDSWMNKCLSLHLDHINGNPIDHRLENLRFLCPNCHSQTDSYCGKKNRIYSLQCSCGNKKSGSAKKCNKCESASRNQPTKIDWPPTEELISMVKKRNYLAVAKLLGVSDNAIRKRIKNHPI